MACVLVPATEAIVTTIITKVLENKEEKDAACGKITLEKTARFSQKMKKLNAMLMGGSALLVFEHVWHGEIEPFFPFLTAAANPADAQAMIHEMATSGVAMAALVTVAWGVLVLVESKMKNRATATVTTK